MYGAGTLLLADRFQIRTAVDQYPGNLRVPLRYRNMQRGTEDVIGFISLGTVREKRLDSRTV